MSADIESAHGACMWNIHAAKYSVSKKTTFLAVTRESIVGFS